MISSPKAVFSIRIMRDRKAILENAWVRCLRDDRDAAPLFELVRTDLGLWVWDLALGPDMDADVQLERIGRELEANRSQLASLAVASTEFVLFLSFVVAEGKVLRVTNKLARLVAECGLELEIVTQSRG